MAAKKSHARQSTSRWQNWWEYVLDFALTLWVLRAPVAGIAFGFLILGFAPQAQDLLVDLATSKVHSNIVGIFLFLVILFLVWAAPTHYAARLLLNTDKRYRARLTARKSQFLDWLCTFMPRALGLLAFVAMFIALGRSQANLPDLKSSHIHEEAMLWLGWFAFFLYVTAILFCWYTIYRENLARSAVMRRLENAAAVPMRNLQRIAPVVLSGGGATKRVDTSQSDFGPFCLLAMFVLFALLPLISPATFAELFPRAFAVPFVIGGWIPLLTYLSARGRRYRAPLIFFLIVGVSILTWIFGDNYAVRRINNAAMIASLQEDKKLEQKLAESNQNDKKPEQKLAASNTSRIILEEAVDLWMKANCSNGNDHSKSNECPRPIIIAAAGGASRAGFFTASVIGQLLDDKLLFKGKGHGLTSSVIGNRIFAISSVSGSSVGATIAVAALAASRDGRSPCRSEPFELWHGSIDVKKVENWRDCLEELMSGDFLTPAFAGFVFHDTLRFLKWPDRATILEQSWENQFAGLMKKPIDGGNQLACAGSLECPFMTLRPVEGRWLPLLVLNGTSVTTGQRIVTTILEWKFYPLLEASNLCTLTARETAAPNKLYCPLFINSFLFHSLLPSSDPSNERWAWLWNWLKWQKKSGGSPDDVRISTAAHNSARFPLISPPGEIRNFANNIVDRIVDGGYFENYGVVTALELAESIRAIEPKLAPFVLVISNDPGIPPDKIEPKPIDIVGAEFLTDITGPIKAIAQVRSATGMLAVTELGPVLDDLVDDKCKTSAAHIRVWPQESQKEKSKARELSMSWWLSKPVQIYLHEQTDFDPQQNSNNNNEQMEAVLNALKGLPGCVGQDIKPKPTAPPTR